MTLGQLTGTVAEEVAREEKEELSLSRSEINWQTSGVSTDHSSTPHTLRVLLVLKQFFKAWVDCDCKGAGGSSFLPGPKL